MSQYFTVCIGDGKFSVPQATRQVSQYINNILFMGEGDEEIQIDQNIISKEIFELFIHFCKINNYTEPIIGVPIRTSNLQDVIDDKNYQFIKEFTPESPKTKGLLKAAEFLVCVGLRRLIASVFACRIYFEDNKAAYLQKKKQLGISDDITFQDQEKYKGKFYLKDEK